MALDLSCKLQTSSIIKLLLLAREYQYVNIQSLTYQTTLKPLLTNFNHLLQYIRKSMQRRYKPSLQTNNSIKKIITITIATVATLYTTVTERDYIALYIIEKDITYENILRRNKKSLKLNLKLLIETGSVNLITDLRNNSTNILWIIRMIIPT